MDGKQGVQAMQIVNPELAIPIHYNDYDVFTSPLFDFQGEVANAGLEHKLHYLSHGQENTVEVPVGRARTHRQAG
jgi:L-ascorbate metabolism protein UlaG (beta-lactamase superfamily)